MSMQLIGGVSANIGDEKSDKKIADYNIILKRGNNIDFDITDAVEPPKYTTAWWDAPSKLEFLMYQSRQDFDIDIGDTIEFYVKGQIQFRGIIVDIGVDMNYFSRVIAKDRLFIFQSTHTMTLQNGHTALDIWEYFAGITEDGINKKIGHINLKSNNPIRFEIIGAKPNQLGFKAQTYEIGTISSMLKQALIETSYAVSDEEGNGKLWQIRDNPKRGDEGTIELREIKFDNKSTELKKDPNQFLWVGGAKINPDDKDIGNITSFAYTKSIDDINKSYNQVLISNPDNRIQRQVAFRAKGLYEKWGMRQKAIDTDIEGRSAPVKAQIAEMGLKALRRGIVPQRKIEFTITGDAPYISRFTAGEPFRLYLPDFNINQWMWVNSSEATYYKDYANATIEALYSQIFDMNNAERMLDPEILNLEVVPIENNDRLNS